MSLADASTCGVSFTAVTNNEDGVLARYGIPGIQDTVQVCETWTGNDYILHTTRIGDAATAWHTPDTAQTNLYQGGSITANAADGGPVHDPVAAGPTSFDYMQVDAATRQASYDNPYHAVYSGGCANPQQIICDPSLSMGAAASTSATPEADTGRKAMSDGKFTKHGLTRRGVRALVSDSDEIGASPEGNRRFRKLKGDTELIITIDKATELLIGEDVRAPGRESKARHRWKKERDGYARELTEIELTERYGDKTIISRKTIELFNVTLGRPVTP